MNYNYIDVLDTLEESGVLNIENEQQIRLLMQTMYELIKHQFKPEVQAIYLNVPNLESLSDEEITGCRVALWKIAGNESQFEEPWYNAVRALICYFQRPLYSDYDTDYYDTLCAFFEFCIDADKKITDEQIISILNEMLYDPIYTPAISEHKEKVRKWQQHLEKEYKITSTIIGIVTYIPRLLLMAISSRKK